MTYLPWIVAALVAVVAFAWGSLRGQSGRCANCAFPPAPDRAEGGRL